MVRGTLEDVEILSDALWFSFPDRFAVEILAAVSALAPQEIEHRPRLLQVALLAHFRRQAAPDDAALRALAHQQSEHGRRLARSLPAFTRPADLVTAGALAVAAARMSGAYDEAERIGSWVARRLSAQAGALPWQPEHVASRPGWLSCERAHAAMLAGDLDRAVTLYARAHAEAGPAPHAHYAGTQAVANLALLSAWRGHLDLARSWLTTLEAMGPVPDWSRRLLTLGAQVAHALIAIEEGDPARAGRWLDDLGPATQDTELWPFVAFAHASHAAVFGDPFAGLARLDAARHHHGATSPDPSTLAGEVLLRSEAELLVRTGAGRRTHSLVTHTTGSPYLAVHAARTSLLAGEPHSAVRTAARALQRPGTTLADKIELHLVIALAHLRAGNTDRAGDAFRAAVRLRSTTTHVKPFLVADSTDIDALARAADVPDPLADHGRPPVNPTIVSTVRLTRREQAVLEALDAGDTAERAAVRLGVAPTTVRSQIRSIYAKLGVARRDEALARAHELGLFQASRTP